MFLTRNLPPLPGRNIILIQNPAQRVSVASSLALGRGYYPKPTSWVEKQVMNFQTFNLIGNIFLHPSSCQVLEDLTAQFCISIPPSQETH
ncbi:MAG: hypothetical protein K940chlam7_01765 [Chlamydiae bacterium]|nr:hypothetical protein [Chlamydiota bacterium]